MRPIVQISLDLTNIEEALETAAIALKAGVDWLLIHLDYPLKFKF